MSFSNNFPTTGPSLELDFANVNALDPRITFTRSSIATVTNSLGLLQTVQANIPRFDYDPVTLAPRGLLIEEQRTNLLTYSEQFDNAAWTKSAGASVTANSTIAPDGTLTADTVTFAASSDFINQQLPSYSAVNGQSVTFSIYAKTATQLIVFGGASPAGTDVFTTTSAGGGWFRQVLTRTFTVTVSGNLQLISSGSIIGAGSFPIWGAQLEAGSFATSYIPTVASQVTRADDLASISTVVPWFNASEGTLFGESSLIGRPTNSTNGFFTLAGGAATLLSYNNSANSDRIVIFDGVNSTAASGASAINTPRKFATAFSSGGIAAVWAGGAVQTSSYGGGFAGSTSANIGGVGRWNGHIRKIAYYPVRLSNANLQALTL